MARDANGGRTAHASMAGWRIAALVAAAVLLACGADEVAFSANVEVIGEDGEPLAGVVIDTGRESLTTDAHGFATLSHLHGPIMAVVRGEGLLAEPVAIGLGDANRLVVVRMRSDLGGRRWVMHAGGNVMLGRRYEVPDDGEPLLPADDIAGGARRVVEHLGPAFATADLGMVNLESVVSNLPVTAAAAGKRFVMNTRPEALAALSELGVDVVALGNDHIRDYADTGVAHTLAALLAAGITHTGAALTAEDAGKPAVVEVAGARVAVFSYTTVTGDSVNDNYPHDSDSVPADLDPADAWMYEPRTWSFTGGTWSVPPGARRIGSAWQLFSDAEPFLVDTAERAAAWASLVTVYPELQDWIARRGHGGAAGWLGAASRDEIAATDARVDVLVVQLHAGYQMQSAPSAYVRQLAREVIDAGADIVIAHHPHVVQGAEWYKGKLIAYSLGNFIFDQDFLVTFPSVFLRLVWEGAELIEARFVPLELAGYRPIPITDGSARRSALSLWEQSITPTYAARAADGEVHTFLLPEPDADTRRAHMRARHHDAVITDTEPAPEELVIAVPAGASIEIDYDGLIHNRAGGAGVLLGRDLFLRMGGFEDDLADGISSIGAHWDIEGLGKQAIQDSASPAGLGRVCLIRDGSQRSDAVIRPVARIPVPEHRVYRDQDGVAVPAEGAASYSLRFLARLEGYGVPYMRLGFYHHEAETAREPTSRLLGEIDLPIALAADGDWHLMEIPIPGESLQYGAVRANMLNVSVRFGPPPTGQSHFELDELAVVEWRRADEMPEGFGAFELIRNPTANGVVVRTSALPLRD